MTKLKKSDLIGKTKPELRKIAKERSVKLSSKQKTVSKIIDKIIKDQQPLKKKPKPKKLTKAQEMDKGFVPLKPGITSQTWYKNKEKKAGTLGGNPIHMKKPCKESNPRSQNIKNRGLMAGVVKLRRSWKFQQQPPSQRDAKHQHVIDTYDKAIRFCDTLI